MKFWGGRSPPELRRATLRIGKRLGFLNVSVPDRSRTSAGAVPHRCRTGPEPVPDRSRTGAGPVLGRFRTSRPDLGPAPTRLGPRPRPGPGPGPAPAPARFRVVYGLFVSCLHQYDNAACISGPKSYRAP